MGISLTCGMPPCLLHMQNIDTKGLCLLAIHPRCVCGWGGGGGVGDAPSVWPCGAGHVLGLQASNLLCGQAWRPWWPRVIGCWQHSTARVPPAAPRPGAEVQRGSPKGLEAGPTQPAWRALLCRFFTAHSVTGCGRRRAGGGGCVWPTADPGFISPPCGCLSRL